MLYMSRRKTALLVFVGLIVVSCLAMFRWGSHAPAPGASALSRLTAQPREVLARSGEWVTSSFTVLINRWNANSRVEDLESENRELRDRILRLSLAVENLSHLREEEALQASLEIDQVLAYVVGLSGEGSNRAFVINKGLRDRVDKDFPVLSGGSLVGRTTKVLDGSARVMLLNDPSSAVAVKVVTSRVASSTSDAGIPALPAEGVRGKLSGVLTGTGLTLEVDRDTSVHIGDEVHTSRLSTVFPEGLYIGSVGELIGRSDFFKTFAVRPAVDYEQITKVQVLRFLDNVESVALLRNEGQ